MFRQIACVFILVTTITGMIDQVDLQAGSEHPNIVWILSEDNSKHYLKLFDPAGAVTPAIDGLAREGIRFSHAFSNAPVCSVARTTLMTGCYLPRFGVQYHRPVNRPVLPFGLRMFPAYLREAGYYTTNNSKQDYNVIIEKDVWNESSKKATWRNRPGDDTPFFHMQTFTDSHESRLHPKAFKPEKQTRHDPATIKLPPHYPQTELFRKTYAYYLDRMIVIDGLVAGVIDKLKEDGLYDDTIIFYTGDHGGVLPRSKGYIYDTGLHVPLVVRVPEKWKHLSPFKPNGEGAWAKSTQVDGFVSFIDMGPTVLNLAGVSIPEQMNGKPFLGSHVSADEVNNRNQAYGYADRFDEQYNFKRSVRIGKFKYVRNFVPYYPDSILNKYRNRMLAVQQWHELHDEGKLNEDQNQFFQPRAAEALYDLEDDPYELSNLAKNPQHASLLNQLRQTLFDKMVSWPDSGMLPEGVVVGQVHPDPAEFAKAGGETIQKLLEVANLALKPYDEIKDELYQAICSDDPLIQHWGIVAAASHGDQFQDDLEQLAKKKQLSFYSYLRLAEYFGTREQTLSQQALEMAESNLDRKNKADVLLFENTQGYLRDWCEGH